MVDPLRLRRAARCPWRDFLHRIRVGLMVAALILIIGAGLR